VRGKTGIAAIDQIRTIDKSRLLKKIATLRPATAAKILDALAEMFEP
jgi:mRNA-degrading endonuclease toxin of MazEF toxin-antitoxin module